MSSSAIAVEEIASIQHVPVFNRIANAFSHNMLFGVKASVALRLTVYGGNFPIGGEPSHLEDQSVDLEPSDTNYVYADVAGEVFNTVTLPVGWPGPMPTGNRALYEIDTDAEGIVDSVPYVVGRHEKGPQGGIGATGPGGKELYQQRKRVSTVSGGGSSGLPTVSNEALGFAVSVAGAAAAGRALGSGSLGESVPYVAKPTSASAGSSAQIYSQNFCFRGNAAGRGGFDVSIRWYQEQIFSVANERCFFGLFDNGTGAIGNVEPDTLPNIIGVGSLAGDSNLSLIHNDGAGTATKVALGANFPARGTASVYELRLWCEANASDVNYSLTNMDTGNSTTGTISSDLPASTQFLAWCEWINNGSTASIAVIGHIQVVAYTRY